MKNKEKYVLTTPMVTGTDGNQMSKSTGNCIWMDDPADEKFGKVMAALDEQIIPYMTLMTDMDMEEVEDFEKKLKSEKINPKDAKIRLAEEIVTIWHGKKEAEKAKENFEKTFQDKAPDFKDTAKNHQTLAKTVAPFTSLASVSDAKRMILQGGVQVDGKTITDPGFETQKGHQLKIGKKTFVTVK